MTGGAPADFGLPERTLAIVRGILAGHPEVEKAIVYGSRAMGKHRKGSDIDLTLVGDRLDHGLLACIARQLEDSPIPYQVDLSLKAHIDNPNLLEHVARVGKVFYERARDE
jgi:predicted nucleotidyltransferase